MNDSMGGGGGGGTMGHDNLNTNEGKLLLSKCSAFSESINIRMPVSSND